ncbi:MAG: type II secretion system F family protein, partial [Candidatus Nanopelagicales bacterium]|nr:type II secretion system F family protein [Candidatus Nanopelagicales bacterium]
MKWIWLAALALVLWRSPSLRLTRRIPHRDGTGEAVSPPRDRLTIGSASTWVALLAAAASLAVLGWPLGALVAPLVGLAIRLGIPRLSTREQQRTRLELARGLPPGIDLLAAALRAGMTDAAALDVVRSASDGPISNHLGLVARALRLGADPRDAWASAIAEPILAPLAEGMIRS